MSPNESTLQSYRGGDTESPVLLVPCGSVSGAAVRIEQHLWDALLIKPAIWRPEILPGEDQIVNEKRFIVIVAGPEIHRTRTSSRGKIVDRGFNELCKTVAAAPSTKGIVISENDISRSSLNVVKMDASDKWKRELISELTRVRAAINPAELPDRVGLLINQLNLSLLEREESVRLCVLCALAGESIFLLGPPGVAKSLIARRIKELFPPDAKAFEYLMNRFSTPDEIFGPVSIVGLKSDRLERKTESYLPGADVVFLDEIWKAGPSIQNALLTAINERIFRNDGVDQPIPMRALISASNELPAEDEGLEALWDRFLVRLQVGNIAASKNRHEMIRGGSRMEVATSEARFVKSELACLDHQIDNVEIPQGALEIIDALIPRMEKFNQELLENWKEQKLDEANDSSRPRRMYVSDRRWKKIGKLLRASALCNGRSVVNELDCYLIAYCIWNDQEHIRAAHEMVIDAIESNHASSGFRQQWRRLQEEAAKLPGTTYARPTPYDGHYKISLGQKSSLLTDGQRSFSRLPKAGYQSLSDDFKPIHVIDSDGHKARVFAKKGRTPGEIVLKKPGATRPLKAFDETTFQLIRTDKSEDAKLVDMSDEITQSYLAKLEEFSAGITAQSQDAEAVHSAQKHLFVDLPQEVIDRWSAARASEKDQLGNLSQEVTRFAKQKGLK